MSVALLPHVQMVTVYLGYTKMKQNMGPLTPNNHSYFDLELPRLSIVRPQVIDL